MISRYHHSVYRLRTSPFLPALLLLTAFSVFAWGTGYKVSLYKSAAEQHRAPEAKILNRGGAPAKEIIEASAAAEMAAADFLIAVAIVPVTPERQPGQREGTSPAITKVLLLRCTPAHFFRPPPANGLVTA